MNKYISKNAIFPLLLLLVLSFVLFCIKAESLIIMQLIVIILSHKLLLSPKGGIQYISLKTEKIEPFMFMDECDNEQE